MVLDTLESWIFLIIGLSFGIFVCIILLCMGCVGCICKTITSETITPETTTPKITNELKVCLIENSLSNEIDPIDLV